jgi:RNA polymerase sigma-70 factor (ECF subfamily)
VAHNRTIDFLRRKRPLEVDLEASSDSGESTWEVLEADEDTSSPVRRLEMGETARAVSGALASLRENYRAILVLRFAHDLSYQEIAEVLDLTMASVKVQLHRARKALARELAKRGFEAPEAFT